MCMIRREKLQQQLSNQRRGPANLVNNNPNLSVTPVSKSGEKTSQASATQTTQSSAGKPKNNSNPNPAMVSIPNQILEQNSLFPIAGNEKSSQPKKQQNANGNATPVKKNSAFEQQFAPALASFFEQNSALTSLAKTVSALPGPIVTSMAGHPPPRLENFMNMKHPWIGDMSAADAAHSLATLANLQALNNSVGGGILVDNSAANLLSKIPKSLTVIPQQRKLSGEEHRHSAS